MGTVEQAIENRKQELLNMKLHDTTSIDKWTHILRVYGGWIYQFHCPPEEGNDYAIFVPETISVEAHTTDVTDRTHEY